jgi:hypothetical protein
MVIIAIITFVLACWNEIVELVVELSKLLTG